MGKALSLSYLTASTPLIISRIWSISSVWFVEDKDKNLMARVREVKILASEGHI